MTDHDGLGDIFADDDPTTDTTSETTSEETSKTSAEAAPDTAAKPGKRGKRGRSRKDKSTPVTPEKTSEKTAGATDKPKHRGGVVAGIASKDRIRETLDPDNVEAAATEYARPAVNVFSARGYEHPDIPEDVEGIKYATDGDGDVEYDADGNPIILYVPPKMISTWRCEYYLQPWRKARLARHMALCVLLFLLTLASVLSATIVSYTAIAAAVLPLALLVNMAFRYGGIAAYKRPMPPIPFLSDLRLPTRQISESYERIVAESEADGTIYVTPVKRYAGPDRAPSPATILTRWMNSTAEWTPGELTENSGGLLDSFKVKLLLADDEAAWTDSDILDTLGQVTGSSPQQWIDARDTYVAAVAAEAEEDADA